MEGNKLEYVAQSTGNVVQSYREIPDTDNDEPAAFSRSRTFVKPKSISGETDGADEKMLSNNEEKIVPNSNVDMADVKIFFTEKQNGDAKLDIGELKTAFVGLTKEELMKYANDPFWVRLRWFLFITFWTLWMAMLIGAIMIIYAAPKCDLPAPKTWWQEGPLTEVDAIINVEDINNLKEKGVQGIIVTWPEDAYMKLENNHNFTKFLKQTNEQGMHVIVELDPSTSSEWFTRSLEKNSSYSNYYIWQSPKIDSNGNNGLPNNWLNVQNKPSWQYSKERKEFYYAPTGKPHLNFRNFNVTEEFIKVIKRFIELGASGIRLKNAVGLLVDSKFQNEKPQPTNNIHNKVIHTDYMFYTHSKTNNLLELGPLLKQWQTVVKSKTDQGPFMIAEENLIKIEPFKINDSLIIDLPVQSYLFNKTVLNVTEIYKGLNTIFNVSNINWPLWKYKSNSALDIVTFLLPGVPLLEKGRKPQKDLLRLRKMPSIMRGNFTYHQINNNTILAFTRVTSGSPGILVALNPTNERIIVDFSEQIPTVSDEVTVQLVSSGYNETDIDINLKKKAHSIPLSPFSAIVLSYVPKSH